MTTTRSATYELLTIDGTYCGPPNSVHGGVAVGRFAQLAPPGPVEVRLLGPPPLDTPLESRTDPDRQITVTGPDGDLACVRSLPDPLAIEPFVLVTDAEVDAAADGFLAGLAETGHAFPTCFACGPDRHDRDALRQFTGPVGGGDTTVARFAVTGTGVLPNWLTWAGLDCPSGHTAFQLADEPPTVAVLGSMRGQVHTDAHAGVGYQVRSRLVDIDRRKHTTEVAMLAPDGTTVASAQAVWIAVDPALFGAADPAEVSRRPSA